VGRQERGIMNWSCGFRTPERENLQNQTLLPHLRLLKTLRILNVFFIGCLENLKLVKFASILC